MLQKSYDDSPTLYIVPTPIGNLGDMTFRAVEILKEVSLIACEDTRTSGKLLKHFEISSKMISLNEQNEEKKIKIIEEELIKGNNVAIISDAGTPVICDPGYKTVREISKLGYNVVCLPGATALVPALVMSGIQTYPFMFYGFLNHKASKRKTELENLVNYKHTIIFYEAPHRLLSTIKDLGNILGNRVIIISREISKLHEEVYRGHIEDFENSNMNIKGEFVIVVEGNVEILEDDTDLIELVDKYIDEGMSKKDSINKVADEKKISRRELYNEYHKR